MIEVSPEAEHLLRFQIEQLKKTSGGLVTQLIAHFDHWISEIGEYSDFRRRIDEGEIPAAILAEYGQISPDYSKVHFGIGGSPVERVNREWLCEFLGESVSISPRCRKLLENRRLDIDRNTMKLRAMPEPPEELIRLLYQK